MEEAEPEVNGDTVLSKELPERNEEAMETEEAGAEEEEAEEEEEEEPIAGEDGSTGAVENGSLAGDEHDDVDAGGDATDAAEDLEDGEEGADTDGNAENPDTSKDGEDAALGVKPSDAADQAKHSDESEDGTEEANEKQSDGAEEQDGSGAKSTENTDRDAPAASTGSKGDASEGAAKSVSDVAKGVTANGVQVGAKAAPMETEETTLSSDSDIEEIEQPSGRGSTNGPAAGAAAANSRMVVIDTEALLAGRSSTAAVAAATAAAAAVAAPRPPPLTRAPPPQLPQHPHGYPPVQQQQQHLMINPSVLQALAQYGINTAGMTPDQLLQLQDYYRRSHEDTEFVLEAPSFIVPYVMESPAELSAKQFMTKVTEEASKAVNGEANVGKDGEKKAEDGGRNGDGDTAAKDPDAAKDVDSNKENKPDKESFIKRDEDFSHLGKWAYYYQAPVGQLLLDQGRCIVEEFIKDDLLKQQKRKAAKEKGGGSEATRFAIKSLTANLAASRKRNAPFRLKMTQCRYCAFETESILVMERHLEMPHMVGTIYQCNFCDFETRSPQVVLSHMAAEHNVTGRLERAPASFQCPLCSYEDSGKSRMTRHLNSCQKKFRIDKNQCLDDWVPPAKVPKIHRGRPNVLGKQFEPVRGGVPGAAGPKGMQQALAAAAAARGRGRPVGSYKDSPPVVGSVPPRQPFSRQAPYMAGSPGMTPQLVRPPPGGPQMLMPPHYQIGNQIYQLVNNQLVPVNAAQARSSGAGVQIIPTAAGSGSPALGAQTTPAAKAAPGGGLKLSSTPSISITPVPRPNLPPSVPSILRAAAAGSQLSITKGTSAGRPDPTAVSKGAFVICEICDGYIKDLEQLRNHMQWIHKVKIHPKMIYNRPPLNCQKCQLRFFTDQGLERHLLGSHGLVTSSMQEAANKGHDSGRCPICGKVYQWKLLHHVSKDHMVTLKPAHLSYKCTVCTATFSMYKQFENHVYSSHSVVAKKIMESSDRKKAAAAAAASGQPIKLNDEITIIPHPSRPAGGAQASSNAASAPSKRPRAAAAPPVVEVECEICDHKALPRALTAHYRQQHLGRCEVEFTPVMSDPDAAEFVTGDVRQQLAEHATEAGRRQLEVEVSDPEDDERAGSSGGSALSKLNKDITITPIGAARPRRTVTVSRPRWFAGPRSAKRRRRRQLAPRSVKERRRDGGQRRRQPSVVELSDSEQPPADRSAPPADGEKKQETEKATEAEPKELDKSESEQMEVDESQNKESADNSDGKGAGEDGEGTGDTENKGSASEDLESKQKDEGEDKEEGAEAAAGEPAEKCEADQEEPMDDE